MFDCSEILFLTVHDPIACKSVCRQNTLHPPSFGISRLWHEYLLLFQYGSRGIGLELGFFTGHPVGRFGTKAERVWTQAGRSMRRAVGAIPAVPKARIAGPPPTE